MLSFHASCICNSDAKQGSNQDNLLFSGRFLPESNGGLSGTPSSDFSQDKPFVTAVFDGRGSGGARAAGFAAEAFHAVSTELHNEQDLAGLLTELHGEFAEKAARDTGIAAAAAIISGDRLYLANYGSCRAYLLRDRSLYLLSLQESSTAFLGEKHGGTPVPYALAGTLQPGDRLLLCTDGLYSVLTDSVILREISSGTDAGVLNSLLQKAKAGGIADSVTAVFLCFY